MLFSRKRGRTIRADIIPLVDVMFFLLVFFMLFSTLETSPSGLNIKLPKAETARSQQATSFVVWIDETGQRYVDQEPVSAETLRELVSKALANNPALMIIIKADRNTLYEHIVAVMDDIRSVGGYRIGLAVERSARQEE